MIFIKKCLRCGWEWASKKEKPICCPKCKSPYWNKEKVRFFKKNVDIDESKNI